MSPSLTCEASHFDNPQRIIDETVGFRDSSMSMEMKKQRVTASEAVASLGALAQEHRLALFRLLIRAGDNGMSAGAIAGDLGIPNSSLSFHLNQLRGAGLIIQERQRRSLIYRANYPAMNALVAYLLENCCAGSECGATKECDVDA